MWWHLVAIRLITVATPDGNKKTAAIPLWFIIWKYYDIFSFLISFPFISSSGWSSAFSGVASSKASGDEDIPGGGVINSEEFIASFYGVEMIFWFGKFLRQVSETNYFIKTSRYFIKTSRYRLACGDSKITWVERLIQPNT